MFSLRSLLGIPDVIIKDLSETVTYNFAESEMVCQAKGKIVNKSSTGSGEIESLVLRVFVDDKYTDIPVRRGEPDIIGFRVLPNGRFPDDALDFDQKELGINLTGRQAKIRLQVLGQNLREYKVKIV